MATPPLPQDSGKPLILAAICLAALVLPLSFTGGAVATPAIGHQLGGSPVALTWITNAFMLTFGSLLMAAGALADQFGRKRMFAGGMVLFTLTSGALALAPSVLWFDVLRGVQGIAAAGALAGGSAALAQEFDGHARSRAFSMLGATFGVGLAFGPVVAGFLIDAFGWRSVFMAIAILGVLSLIFGIPRMRETRDPNATRLDRAGTALFTATLALFTFSVIQAPETGWGSPLVLALLGGAALALAGFVIVETRQARPMLDLSLFRYARFVGVQMLPIGTCYSFIVLVVMLPMRLIGVQRMTEMEAGLMMIALSVPISVVPFLATSLARRVPAGILCGIGFLIAAAGLHWLSQVDFDGPALGIVLPMLAIGIGSGLPWGLMDGLAIGVVPVERAGMAAGIFNTARVASEGVTLAIVSALLAGLTYANLSGSVAPGTVAFSHAMDAGQRLTTGGLDAAIRLLPSVSEDVITRSYDDAFRTLLHVLTGVTVLAALAAFGFLAQPRKRAQFQNSTALNSASD